MKKKIISVLIIILVIGGFILNHLSHTYAAIAEPPLYVNLATTVNNIGYGNANPNPDVGDTSNEGEYIWNIITHDSHTSSASAVQRNLYCVKADYGETWFTAENHETVIEYNLSYDMQTDREYLLSNLEDNGNTADEVVKELLTPGGGQYEQLLWVLDNAYIPGTDVDKYLEQVGVLSEDNNGTILYYDKVTNKYLTNGGEPVTSEDIIAVQKMVIWYFTNGGTLYDRTSNSNWLNITTNGTNYNSLSEISESRNSLAMYIYNYLITNAKTGASQYTAQNGYKLDTAPISINGFTEDKTDSIKTIRKNENYLIGPIVIEKQNDLGYDIEILVTDQSGNVLEENTDYKYTDKDGNILPNITTTKDLVGISNEGFYIKVSRDLIENINIKINVSYKTTPKTLWLQGTEDEDSEEIKLDAEQPLVEITQESKDFTVELTSAPEEFDLALRKYITKVNGTNVTNTREPNIDETTLLTGTTATYKHRKEPIVVQDKDEVTYNITIYNEGNKAGYATKIIDQLPIGLVSSTNNTSVVVSKGPNGEKRNQYKLQYDPYNNKIELILIKWPEELEQDISQENEGYVKDLQPYTTGNLDYETIEIKCMVAQEADTKNQIVLTNVAWIASAYNSEDNKEITTTVGEDRDSEPETKPNVNKDNMQNYKGKDTNKEDLSDAEYFYQGQQDDDDFEKLVIMPIVKKFDLALFKHIAAISKDQTIENGEYVTDTGNIDGIYLRAPVVTSIDPETGKITYQQDDKAALTVEPGDYVLYTIRVYNEGEINGYASKIKDTLPIGLEFVIANEEYNGIWNLDGLDEDGRQIVSTTWYAKGQGAEADAVEGDPNYKANLLTALNKEAAISNENPDYIDAQVLCRVVEQSTSNRVLVNNAEISDDSDENGDPIDDVDSTPDEWIDEDDDQDIERIKLQCFDLSLRKFITSVNGENPKTSRVPVVDVSNLVNKTETTSVYTHTKKPLAVKRGDRIIYTIRVYNEGDIKGFASEVKDYLPPYLIYVENSEINTQYGWEISEDGRVATTTYLKDTELQAFNGTDLDYADLKIECIVSERAPLTGKQTNIAEISEYTYNGSTVSKDIDSTSDNIENKIPTDENLPSYKDEEINNSYVPGNEDDDDLEKVYIKTFDLSLRKFVTVINGEELEVSREPKVDVTPLKDGTGTTAIYNHPKTPVALKIGDKVIYTIRVYNEGEIAGYANEVKDYLPPYLEFVENSPINSKYGWSISEDGRIATTTYLSDKEISEFNGTTLDYEDIQIECIITENAIPEESITNIAEISEYKYGETVVTEDIDSESDNIDENIPEDEELPDYKKDEEEKQYVPGNEDDDDFEKVYVKEFDLALRKFITQIQGKDVTTRVPQTKIENGVISYEHPKDALIVHVGDVVIYTLRIYNEGEIDGYASEITDDIPEYLEYLPEESTNVQYMWKMYDENGNETEKVEEAVKVKTQYLSKENGEENLLKAFDGETLSYKDIKIAFKVKDPNSNTYIITNHAQISDDTDEDGNTVKDKDSETDEWNEGEDDQDIENVKVEYFDLSLLKFVSKVIVIEDGKEKITETGYNGHENPEPVVKVEIHKKNLKNVVVKFGYGITITNEGDIPGYATEITDYVPQGLRFEATDNPEWKDEGNGVISTKQLENTLLQPGQSETIEVIFTWINDPENLALKTNTAEISEDKNEYDVPDRDSTPDNKQDGEDDIDIAKVILAIKTGAAQTYFTLTLGLLSVVLIGVFLIKKFVI